MIFIFYLLLATSFPWPLSVFSIKRGDTLLFFPLSQRDVEAKSVLFPPQAFGQSFRLSIELLPLLEIRSPSPASPGFFPFLLTEAHACSPTLFFMSLISEFPALENFFRSSVFCFQLFKAAESPPHFDFLCPFLPQFGAAFFLQKTFLITAWKLSGQPSPEAAPLLRPRRSLIACFLSFPPPLSFFSL